MTLASIDLQVMDEYDVVVNCAGLDNRQLTGDKKMSPVRGQVMRVSSASVPYCLKLVVKVFNLHHHYMKLMIILR